MTSFRRPLRFNDLVDIVAPWKLSTAASIRDTSASVKIVGLPFPPENRLKLMMKIAIPINNYDDAIGT